MTTKKKTSQQNLTRSTGKTSRTRLQSGFSPRPATRLALAQTAGESLTATPSPSLLPSPGTRTRRQLKRK